MDSPWIHLSVGALRERLEAGDVSALEIAEAHLEAIDRARGLNAFISVDADATCAMAQRADVMQQEGAATPLTGIPVALKDVLCTTDWPTTAGSNILSGYVSAVDAFVVRRLREAGAVFVGKTNLDEFAMGSANVHSAFGPAQNPWRRQTETERPLTPGGSSGGSAAAVAARCATVALGTDTGGSVRSPASYCGLVGIKPTYGRCSRWGVVAYASSLDQVGVLGRSLSDACAALSAIHGHDRLDATSIDEPPPDLSRALQDVSLRGRTIGILRQMRDFDLDPDIAKAWQTTRQWLEDEGARIIDVSVPTIAFAHAAYFVIATCEASSNLSRYDGLRYGNRVSGPAKETVDALITRSRSVGFGSEVQWRLFSGAFALSAGYADAYYGKAQAVRKQLRREFLQEFERVDAMLMPTTPTVAFPLDAPMPSALEESLNDLFLGPVSLAGLPALSLPVGVDAQGLPIGMQLAAAPRAESRLVAVASAVERAAQFALPQFPDFPVVGSR